MNTLRRSLYAVVALLGAAACGGSDTGKVTVRLTDAPGDFKAAVVTITEVDLVGSGGTFHMISNKEITTDLLTLSNQTAEIVKDVEVPAGTYGQLRFVITGGYVQVEQADGSVKTFASSPDYAGLPAGTAVDGVLRMPSFAQSGLKVNLPGGSVTVGGGTTVVLVDFDVSQSFGHEAGNSGAWVMHPVCKAERFELSGTVNVTAALAAGAALPGGATLGEMAAVLTNDAGSAKRIPLALDAATNTWGVSFKYLIPGVYTLSLEAPWAFTSDPTIPQTLTVASGQSVSRAFAITPGGTQPNPL
ncbi:MAG TPA: DUF4382 domain-containing protein [Anaeromyxobacteraceae bacterium]|nr:DUF4382 domain-containing protein [Anaeromyxobacteraceae bacterium]